MRTIEPAKLKAIIDSGVPVTIIDIREPEKFQAGHLKGSINIFQKDIPQHIDRISRTEMVVIVCAYGMKSDQVYLFLREKHKFKNLWILEGGLYDWSVHVDPDLVVL